MIAGRYPAWQISRKGGTLTEIEPQDIRTRPSPQFGTRNLFLVTLCVAFSLAMRGLSVRHENETWITYAPIIIAAVAAGGNRLFGVGKFRSVLIGVLFALVASVAHAVELVLRSPAFEFLRRGKIDLSSDPVINAIEVAITTGEAIIAAAAMVLVLSVLTGSGHKNAG